MLLSHSLYFKKQCQIYNLESFFDWAYEWLFVTHDQYCFLCAIPFQKASQSSSGAFGLVYLLDFLGYPRHLDKIVHFDETISQFAVPYECCSIHCDSSPVKLEINLTSVLLSHLCILILRFDAIESSTSHFLRWST